MATRGIVRIALAAAAALVLTVPAMAAMSGGSTAGGTTINGTKYNFGSAGWSLDPKFAKQEVSYPTTEAPGTIIISTHKRFLYLVLGNGKALRYGIGVGRYGFTWQGVEKVSRKAEWPDWHPPKEMQLRDPTVPDFMKGGPGNPLGARAMYLGNTEYRIHGTAQPWTIGTSVSSGCIRLTNDDVTDLYNRVKIGAKVIVQ
ncbi:MAG: L,D-transpeptidase [Hyphomicrobiales bacterium]